jgi:hypothetical protein
MVEPIGCFSISEKAAVRTNWAAVVSVVGGLVLALLAETAAHGLHTRAAYFFGPGIGLAGVGTAGLAIVNCCRKDDEISQGGWSRRQSSPARRQERISQHVEFFFPEIKKTAEYQAVGSYKPRIPSQKVSTIFTVDSVWNQIITWAHRKCDTEKAKATRRIALKNQPLEERQQQETAALDAQKTHLSEHYHYQVVDGSGDCFYISLLSGVLHQMVRENNKEAIVTLLRREAQGIENSNIANVVKLVSEVTDLTSLVNFLISNDKVNTLVQFLRKLAYKRQPEDTKRAEILTMKKWAQDEEARDMVRLFGGKLAITPEYEGYAALASTQHVQGVFEGNAERAPFIVVYRNNNHYDVLLNKDMLAAIGVSRAPSTRAPRITEV